MVFIGGLGGTRLAGDGQAAFGVGAHFVEGRLVRALDLLAVGAGLGARDRRSGARAGMGRLECEPISSSVGLRMRETASASRWARAVGAGAHVVERGLAERGRRA